MRLRGISGRSRISVSSFSFVFVCHNLNRFPIGSSLKKQIIKAITMAAKHCAIANKFSAQYPPATIEKWTKMIADWDADTTKPCPYEDAKQGKSQIL
jgi:hypothetical protein